jgi:hypothetical protein
MRRQRGSLTLTQYIIVLLVQLVGLVALAVYSGHEHEKEEEKRAALMTRVSVQEPLLHVQRVVIPRPHDPQDVSWSYLETQNYMLLNGSVGGAQLCQGLIPMSELPMAGGEVVLLEDLATRHHVLKLALVLPSPADKDFSVQACPGFSAAGDHFEYEGKTVAFAQKIE